MSYINALINRRVFDALRYWMVVKGFSYRSLFWITGILAFFISPVADNLTTALIMCTVVMTVGSHHQDFVKIACINIVVAANAGGAFSPFGDITTLMVWQKGIIEFTSFFQLFIPAVVNFVVPAICMHFSIPRACPRITDGKAVEIAQGGLAIAGLFLLTILTAVCFHSFLHLPPAIGMLTGLGYLKFFSYYQSTIYRREQVIPGEAHDGKLHGEPIDVFKHIADADCRSRR